MILPFVLMLLGIATMPFINKVWWEHHYAQVATGLGTLTVLYYLFGLKNPGTVLSTAHEYVSFIALIGSLFVVSGGIHINVKGEARPLANCVFLMIGAILANVIGTTGASMLLIRPWIRTNKYRITAFHIVFFIFIVSNCAGCLTPIGDPPLFLGFLKGIPFWWTAEHLWIPWATVVGLLLAVFYFFDRRNFLKAPPRVRELETAHGEVWKFDGGHNLFFLVLILAAVFFGSPLREILMIAAAVASYFTTSKPVHESNEFSFGPIKEVSYLFIGIFATMMPALDYLRLHARDLGIVSPLSFYFCSGFLSSVLDNAPTYLTFLSGSIGLFVDQDIISQVQHLISTHGSDAAQLMGVHAVEVRNTFFALQKYHSDLVAAGKVPLDDIEIAYLLGNNNLYIIAVSLGSVFFGAMTYIGNGPNFMVKSIAESARVATPDFLTYALKYALPLLFPILVLAGLLYLIFFPHLVQ